eukprot:gene12617-15845_t
MIVVQWTQVGPILLSPNAAISYLKQISLGDKELEFNGQLMRKIIVRESDISTVDIITKICSSTEADMIVVPSLRLAGAIKGIYGAACIHHWPSGILPASITDFLSWW